MDFASDRYESALLLTIIKFILWSHFLGHSEKFTSELSLLLTGFVRLSALLK